MSEEEQQKFFNLGLGFPSDISGMLSSAFIKLCPLLGLTAGVGLAIAGNKDMVSRGPKNTSVGLALILIGLGVGVAAVGGMCTQVKLHLNAYLDKYPNAVTAIAALTPDTKAQLINECQKIIKLKDKIEATYKERFEEKFPMSA